jgi:hypothetical protein
MEMSGYSEATQKRQRDWCYLVEQSVRNLENNIGTENEDWFADKLRERFDNLMSHFAKEDN